MGLLDVRWVLPLSQGGIAFLEGTQKLRATSDLTWDRVNRVLQMAGVGGGGVTTIQTATGNLTIATRGGDGNILLAPNGTGGIGLQGPTDIGYVDNIAYDPTVANSMLSIINQSTVASTFAGIVLGTLGPAAMNASVVLAGVNAGPGDSDLAIQVSSGGVWAERWRFTSLGNLQCSGDINFIGARTVSATTNLTAQAIAGFLTLQSNLGTLVQGAPLVMAVNLETLERDLTMQAKHSSLDAVIDFYTTSLGSLGLRWTMLGSGTLQSNGAQTIQTSTGNLTLATGAANGNIFCGPNGSGGVLPVVNLATNLGDLTHRWANLYATNVYGAMTPTGFTQKSIIFAGAGGVLTQDNAHFQYDPIKATASIGVPVQPSASQIGRFLIGGSFAGDGASANNAYALEVTSSLVGNSGSKAVLRGVSIVPRFEGFSGSKTLIYASHTGTQFPGYGLYINETGTTVSNWMGAGPTVCGGPNASPYTGGGALQVRALGVWPKSTITMESGGTLRTETGDITLATSAANGNIYISPNGSGKCGVGVGVGKIVTSPSSLLHVGGSLATPQITQTATTLTLDITHQIVWANTTSNSITITLPTAVGIGGRQYTIKKVAAANTLSIVTTGGQAIDGDTSLTITAQYVSVTVVSNDLMWYII